MLVTKRPGTERGLADRAKLNHEGNEDVQPLPCSERVGARPSKKQGQGRVGYDGYNVNMLVPNMCVRACVERSLLSPTQEVRDGAFPATVLYRGRKAALAAAFSQLLTRTSCALMVSRM